MAEPLATTVFRDDYVLVVDKPSGVDTQALHQQLQAERPYVGLHHRLDQPASGLLLFTLDPSANAAIAKALREHRIERLYQAVLYGTPQQREWRWKIDGQGARTELLSLAEGAGFAAVWLKLHTGRTHQVRKHAAHAGTPLAGDRRYGGEAGRAWPRLALHAARLSFAHPITGALVVVSSPLPAELTALWAMSGGAT